MAFAKLPDAQLFYQWDGPEKMPALVFSNSLGTTHRMWDAQIEAFSKQFRVLRYDNRGHGQSSVTPGPYTIEKLADDILRLLDTLQVDRIHFCGLSMGGQVGMYLAANIRSRLNNLVLCSTAAKIGTPDVWNARITAVQQGGMKAVAGAVLERWFTAACRASHKGDLVEIQQMLEGADPVGYVASCSAVRDMDFREKLGAVQAPTLVIAGEHDPATPPADGRFLAEHIRGARFVELPAAHLANIEARDAFNSTVLGFLKSQGAHG
jgi:3-oxoadipate enol-lactonase